MKNILALWVLMAISFKISAQDSLLQAGDLAIISFQADNNDQFVFVNLVTVYPGTKIQFSEKGWNGSLATPAFASSSEAIHAWTSPNHALLPGSFIRVDFNSSGASPVANLGTVQSTGNSGFAASGDQLIAFQGSPSNPRFLYALSSNPWLSTGSPSSNQSWLPTGLMNGVTARDFPKEMDDQYYAQEISMGSKDSLLAMVGRVANWYRTNTRVDQIPEWHFYVYRGYYSKAVGSLSKLDTWGLEIDGTGTHPTNFTDSGYTFYLSNRSGLQSLDSNWTLKRLCIGAGIKLALHGFVLSFQDLAQEGLGKLLVDSNDQITITGQSGPLMLEGDTASLKKLVLSPGAMIGLSIPLQIPGGPMPGSVTLDSYAVLTTNNKLILCSNAQGAASLQQLGTSSQLIGQVIMKNL
ncbi:MAG: hypothetical protein B7Y69_11115 [Sphingobacteriia bacterium 35-40-8]|nr:MAG: hypothetical protein B7Y69_11115 [Sphingobacteriia bacterium 35-40-8]OZA68239.1 MAG: hypothetical protein B7X72_02250 [Sphingobacteriia bacterium 39-39-8]HQR91704.1 hypothetical protein [Sediminibacterium sp.]